MSAGVSFPEFIQAVKPGVIFFPPRAEPNLNAADMLDQAVLLKQLFGGRWPSRG